VKDAKMDFILMNKIFASRAISNVNHVYLKISALFVILEIFYNQMELVKISAQNKENF
jgi:hypothetical protein